MTSDLPRRALRQIRAIPPTYRSTLSGGIILATGAWFFPLNGIVHALLWSVGCTLIIAGALYQLGVRHGTDRVLRAVEVGTVLSFTHWAEEVLADQDIDMEDAQRARLQADYHRAQKRLRELT